MSGQDYLEGFDAGNLAKYSSYTPSGPQMKSDLGATIKDKFNTLFSPSMNPNASKAQPIIKSSSTNKISEWWDNLKNNFSKTMGNAHGGDVNSTQWGWWQWILLLIVIILVILLIYYIWKGMKNKKNKNKMYMPAYTTNYPYSR